MGKTRKLPAGTLLVVFVPILFCFSNSVPTAEYSSNGTPCPMPHSFLSKMREATDGQFEIVYVKNRKASGEGSFKAALTGGKSNITRLV